jgi:hypothetical protein
MIVYGIILKQQTLKEPKIIQMGMVLHKRFSAMHSKGKPVTGTMITEEATTLYD